jgi:hypothetical protein
VLKDAEAYRYLPGRLPLRLADVRVVRHPNATGQGVELDWKCDIGSQRFKAVDSLRYGRFIRLATLDELLARVCTLGRRSGLVW